MRSLIQHKGNLVSTCSAVVRSTPNAPGTSPWHRRTRARNVTGKCWIEGPKARESQEVVPLDRLPQMARMKFAHSQPGFSGQGDVRGYGCRVLIHYPLETFQGFGDFSQSQVELATIYVENETASFGVLRLSTSCLASPKATSAAS